MAPLEGQLRQVYFFDTPDLTLNQHGWSSAPATCSGAATTR
jgi:hypothetical protein